MKLKRKIKFCKKCGEYMYKPDGKKRFICSNILCPQKLRDYEDTYEDCDRGIH